MSYHKFLNLGEKFNSDLQSKVMREIDDKTWNDRKCNCDVRTNKAVGTCLYEGLRRKATVVYELKCSLCDTEIPQDKNRRTLWRCLEGH